MSNFGAGTKMSGWVKMKKKKAFAKWRQRFITLDGPALTYYDNYNPNETHNQHRGAHKLSLRESNGYLYVGTFNHNDSFIGYS